MRNFVAKHARINRASTHRDKTKYSRGWEMDWDEIEPPQCFL